MAAVRFAAHPPALATLNNGRLVCDGATLMRCGRLGYDGATLMKFKLLTLAESLARRFSNMNFSVDCGSPLPSCTALCESYNDFVEAIDGLA